MVLHTWTCELRFHPHVHALVTAGGLALDGSCWSPSHRKYLFPVEEMGALLRGKMLAALRTLYRRGAFARFSGFDDPQGFERLMQKLASAKRWIVYAKRPFARVDHVLKYLGRYTHRVRISNSRLALVSADAVTFRTKNGQAVNVTPVEFLRRFVQHVLPDGVHKIRHYGFYAGATRDARSVAQKLLAPKTKATLAAAGTTNMRVRSTPQSHGVRCPPLPAMWRRARASARAVQDRTRATCGCRCMNTPTRSRCARFVRTRANRISLAIAAVVTAPIVAPIARHAIATSTQRARRNLSSLGLHRRAASKRP